MSKILVAYFSASGVTENVAKKLTQAAEADLYEIKPVNEYTEEDLNWNNKSSRSSMEMNDSTSRPEIATVVKDMNQYETVFVGFPIWWYVAPRIINTFLESYDFSNKNIVLFATSGGSELGNTQKELESCVGAMARWITGKRFPENVTAAELKEWVNRLSL